jgi:monofunctional chorismate mutase
MERELQRYRAAIDRIDGRLVRLLKKRLSLVKRVGRLKEKRGMNVVQPKREEEILSRLSDAAGDEETRAFLDAVYRALFKASYRVEGEGQ